MKLQTALSILAAIQAVAVSALPAVEKRAPNHAAFSRPVGRVFEIDEKVQYFMGTNTYWIGFLTNDNDIDLVMKHLKESKMKVLRVWGFNDVNALPEPGTVYYQALIPGQEPYINLGPDGLQRLDVVVHKAVHYGIKLIIPFINNWGDYGGIQAYGNYFGTNATNWYTSAPAQAQYRKYIKAVVRRYKHSNAIFAWELGNEPRCKGCSTDIIYNWAKSTSEYIKSLDSRHMVTLGDEGWLVSGGDGAYPYQGGEGVDFERNLGIETLDFGTFHQWPHAWSMPYEWGSQWIKEHDEIGKKLGKPVILEEYGDISDNHTATRLPWLDTVYYDTKIAGDMYWQYADFLSDGPSPDDGNAVYYGTPEYKPLVIDHAARMVAKPVV
ncbi:hypothetical protein TWF569_006238 [Orbilia oligospora]|uniref:mannan endo-1,4-beta-mannosidase n=1 Tax=Orbilia oligospora TaxID=2813651 RepID=A0A7C8JCH8_ORBOL|nr:hypothetical protein TWF706_001770 [Orbilia oligospora]KAF3110651.1 hypothetical protein TWF102_008216 [Orbilia oligospora]KAF3114747.1 hypothetical protein TWF103_000485 [Orbilia oligospora]KAF3143470.1 hypothetical protein TWF703_010884 [Orbilia oligospora]KAF3147156.1 hypothetical protein TWF569_006238 [Orbilia oligospora]